MYLHLAAFQAIEFETLGNYDCTLQYSPVQSGQLINLPIKLANQTNLGHRINCTPWAMLIQRSI